MKVSVVKCLLDFGIAFALLCLPTSCSKDDVDYGLGAYEEQLAEVHVIAGKPAFLLDNGSLLCNAGTAISSDIKDSARVYMNYTLLPGKTQGFDQAIRINWIRNIGYRELQALDSVIIARMPNDPIFFESAWIGSHYLNMIFDISYKSQPHKISLVVDPAKLNDKYIPIYFRHDQNNDPEGSKNNVIASFDLEKILGSPSGNKTLQLNIHSTNYGNKTYEINY